MIAGRVTTAQPSERPLTDEAEKRPVGRPSIYTPELADDICERLSCGEPLAHICARPGMPAVRTVSDWKTAHEDFSANFVRARDDGFDALAAECLRISNTPETGVETVTRADGVVETREGDMLGHRKLQIETRLKLLAKWDPKRYGERQQLDLAGAFSVTIAGGDEEL